MGKSKGRPQKFIDSVVMGLRIEKDLYNKIPGKKQDFVRSAIESSLKDDRYVEELRKIVFMMYEHRDDPYYIHKLYWEMRNPPEIKWGKLKSFFTNARYVIKESMK